MRLTPASGASTDSSGSLTDTTAKPNTPPTITLNTTEFLTAAVQVGAVQQHLGSTVCTAPTVHSSTAHGLTRVTCRYNVLRPELKPYRAALCAAMHAVCHVHPFIDHTLALKHACMLHVGCWTHAHPHDFARGSNVTCHMRAALHVMYCQHTARVLRVLPVPQIPYGYTYSKCSEQSYQFPTPSSPCELGAWAWDDEDGNLTAKVSDFKM